LDGAVMDSVIVLAQNDPYLVMGAFVAFWAGLGAVLLRKN